MELLVKNMLDKIAAKYVAAVLSTDILELTPKLEKIKDKFKEEIDSLVELSDNIKSLLLEALEDIHNTSCRLTSSVDDLATTDDIEYIFAVIKDGIIITVIEYLFTYGLCTDPDYDVSYNNRFCYPKNKFSKMNMLEITLIWDGKSLPPDGWTKYKGVQGEYSPKDKDKILF